MNIYYTIIYNSIKLVQMTNDQELDIKSGLFML